MATRPALIVSALLLAFSANSAEIDYQRKWCADHKGRLEVTVPGGRIDCLTDRYAVEFDFAPKWKDCIVQAKWYAIQTGRIPACALITSPTQDIYLKYLEDYLHGTDSYIRVWRIPK